MASPRLEEVTVAVVDDTKWANALGSAVAGDAWRPSGGDPHEVRSPATGRFLGGVGIASPGDVDAAAGAAALAQPAWAQTGTGARAGVFLRAAELLEAERDAVVGWLTREGGAIGPKGH